MKVVAAFQVPGSGHDLGEEDFFEAALGNDLGAELRLELVEGFAIGFVLQDDSRGGESVLTGVLRGGPGLRLA